MEATQSEPQFSAAVVAAINAKSSVRQIVARKFGPDFDGKPLWTMIGFAFFRQLVEHVVDTANDGEVQAPMVFRALDDMGMPKIAEKAEKRDRRFRHRRKIQAIQSLRNDPEIGVTSDICIDFARSLVDQNPDERGIAAFMKKRPQGKKARTFKHRRRKTLPFA